MPSQITQELCERFFSLPLFHDGREVSYTEKQKDFNLNLHALGDLPENSLVPINDSNPYLFAVKFLSSLNLNQVPVLVPKTPNLNLPSKPPASDIYGVRSSGSTGEPKVYFFQITQAIKNAQMHMNAYDEFSDIENVIQTVSLQHSFGLVAILITSLLSQKKLHLFSQTPSLTLLNRLSLNKNILYLTPTLLRFYSKVKSVALRDTFIASIGSAAINRDDFILVKTFFPEAAAYITYGLSEAGPRVSASRLKEDSFSLSHPMGKPLKDVEVLIQGIDGQISNQGRGLLAIRSPCLALNIDDSNISDGALVTQDDVTIKGENVFFHGRSPHLIKKGGVSIYAQQIESVVRQLSSIGECCVFKRKDTLNEEEPVLVYSGKISEDEIRNRLLKELPVHWVPSAFYRVEEFPYTELRKVNRDLLRQELQKKNGQAIF